jgi:hypothetical protein
MTILDLSSQWLEQLRAHLAGAGPGQADVAAGPYYWPHPEGLADAIRSVDELTKLSEPDRATIMGGNLARLVALEGGASRLVRPWRCRGR